MPLAIIKKFNTLKYIVCIAKGSRLECGASQLAAATPFTAVLVTDQHCTGRCTGLGAPLCSWELTGSWRDAEMLFLSITGVLMSVLMHHGAPRRVLEQFFVCI